MELPVYKIIGGGDYGILTKPYLSSWGDTIPSGYIWDGATLNIIAGIPKFGDSVDIATIEHDYIYVYEGKLPSGKLISRHKADTILYHHLRNGGYDKLQALKVYFLVRIFGGIKWKTKLNTK